MHAGQYGCNRLALVHVAILMAIGLAAVHKRIPMTSERTLRWHWNVFYSLQSQPDVERAAVTPQENIRARTLEMIQQFRSVGD